MHRQTISPHLSARSLYYLLITQTTLPPANSDFDDKYPDLIVDFIVIVRLINICVRQTLPHTCNNLTREVTLNLRS